MRGILNDLPELVEEKLRISMPRTPDEEYGDPYSKIELDREMRLVQTHEGNRNTESHDINSLLREIAELRQRENKYLKIISHLKKHNIIQKRHAKVLRQEKAIDFYENSDLKEFFLSCIDEV